MRALMGWVIALVIVTAPASAEPGAHIGYRGWGPRVGLSSGPDQIHVGAHMDFGNFAQNLRFQPNIEMGFGSDRILTTFNLETAYQFRSTWGAWSPYAGGGVGLDMVGGDNGRSSDHTDVGASALGGIERGLSGGDRFFLETKFGLTHDPDLKLTVGWIFY